MYEISRTKGTKALKGSNLANSLAAGGRKIWNCEPKILNFDFFPLTFSVL